MRTPMIAFILLLFCCSPAIAQPLEYTFSDLEAVMPDKHETPTTVFRSIVEGFPSADNRFSMTCYSANRLQDQFGVRISVYVFDKELTTWKELVCLPSRNTPLPPEDSRYRNHPLGTIRWVSQSHDEIMVADGRVALTVQLRTNWIKDPNGQLQRGPDGELFYPPVHERDFKMVLGWVSKILDRLTALGLTSRPKEQAPEWAKKEMPVRLKKVREAAAARREEKRKIDEELQRLREAGGNGK